MADLRTRRIPFPEVEPTPEQRLAVLRLIRDRLAITPDDIDAVTVLAEHLDIAIKGDAVDLASVAAEYGERL